MGPDIGTQELALVIPIVAVGGSMVVAIIAVVASAVRRSIEARAFEQSRREIAAYVAEGSITPDDAAKLLAEGKKPRSRCWA
jgi:hypothetical protein